MPSIFHVLPLLLVLLSPSLTRSQDPSTSAPTVTLCQPQLLSLVSCAPFVQGMAPSPPQSCCDSLNLLYSQQPHCLCLMLNATNIVSIPINNTLALQLPHLCNIPANPSSCVSSPVSPASQVSLGANSSRSAVASSPATLAAPGPSVMGQHDTSSGGTKSEIEIELEITARAATMIMTTTMMMMMMLA